MKIGHGFDLFPYFYPKMRLFSPKNNFFPNSANKTLLTDSLRYTQPYQTQPYQTGGGEETISGGMIFLGKHTLLEWIAEL